MDASRSQSHYQNKHKLVFMRGKIIPKFAEPCTNCNISCDDHIMILCAMRG